MRYTSDMVLARWLSLVVEDGFGEPGFESLKQSQTRFNAISMSGMWRESYDTAELSKFLHNDDRSRILVREWHDFRLTRSLLTMVQSRLLYISPLYRCTTSCLLCFLASAYPAYALVFQFLIALDFSSHYIHMYSWVVSRSIAGGRFMILIVFVLCMF